MSRKAFTIVNFFVATLAFADDALELPPGGLDISDNSVRIVYGGTAASLEIEAMAEFVVAAAKAEYIHEVAVRERILNRVREMEARLKQVNINNEIKNAKWNQSMLEYRQLLAKKLDAQDRMVLRWVELEVNVAEAKSGYGLNLLMDLLPSTQVELEASTKPIPLDASHLRSLKLMLSSGETQTRASLNGDGFGFRPPRELRNLEGATEWLDKYKAARETMIDSLKKGVRPPDQAFDDATEALNEIDKLAKEFRKTFVATGNKDPKLITYFNADKFVREQMRQTLYLLTENSLPAKFEGNTIQELVTYMKSHGYKFAAADNGGENSYKAVFDGVQALIRELRRPPLAPRFQEVLPKKENNP